MTDTKKFKFRPLLDTRYNVQETEDGDLAVFFDRNEVIDLYDSSNAMDEVSWCEHGDPQTEQSEIISTNMQKNISKILKIDRAN